MGRERTRPIHPWVKSLMGSYSCDTLAELSRATKIPLTTLISWADFDANSEELGKLGMYKSLYENSRRLGISIDELVCGLLFIQEQARVG
jgi:hypothetical protein